MRMGASAAAVVVVSSASPTANNASAMVSLKPATTMVDAMHVLTTEVAIIVNGNTHIVFPKTIPYNLILVASTDTTVIPILDLLLAVVLACVLVEHPVDTNMEILVL
jgi:hypothetical protein